MPTIRRQGPRRSVSSEIAMSEAGTDHGATLHAWRERGDHRHDPVRFCFIEALARRALVHQGATRRVLDDRLAQLLAVYGEEVESARLAKAMAATAEGSHDGAVTSQVTSMLPGLTGLTGSDGRTGAGTMTSTLKYFRSTWSRLSAERHLSQSHATVPDNPGPLNSHHLVHQALKSMRDLSPGYLSHFMLYVDALLWLDDANGVAAALGASAQREAAQKRATKRGKPMKNGDALQHLRESKNDT